MGVKSPSKKREAKIAEPAKKEEYKQATEPAIDSNNRQTRKQLEEESLASSSSSEQGRKGDYYHGSGQNDEHENHLYPADNP